MSQSSISPTGNAAASVPAYAVQTLFCDELSVPLAPHLSQFVSDKLTEALQALDCALKRVCVLLDTGRAVPSSILQSH